MGIPYQIICGKRINEGIVELKNRMTDEKTEVSVEEAINTVLEAVKNIK